jgi:macrolide transport system ATP-binding/permease protein
MSTFLYNIRYPLRQLQKNPGSIAVAVLTLALGVCSSVAIFAFVDAALIKPLPYQDPSRLVALDESIPLGPKFQLSYLDDLDWKNFNKDFHDFTGYENDGFMISAPRVREGVTVSFLF